MLFWGSWGDNQGDRIKCCFWEAGETIKGTESSVVLGKLGRLQYLWGHRVHHQGMWQGQLECLCSPCASCTIY